MKSKKTNENIMVAVIIVALLVFLMFLSDKIQFLDGISESNTQARELVVLLEENGCKAEYLGVYQVENYGEMELFCENGEYFGNISDSFSISMSEMKQKDYFNAIFCMDECFSHPITIIDGVLTDVFGKYVRAEK